jgi:ABC-2 type transport system permease protein
MNTMTMKWLLRREFWENKGSMFWAPAIVAALLVLLVGATLSYGLAQHGVPMHITVNGQSVNHGALSAFPVESKQMVAKVATGLYLAAASPLFFMLVFAVFFYCLGALYEERRDRSILFWKSLPISDQMTVLSKAATAMLVAPLITIALATACSLALLLVACVALSLNGVNMFGAVLSSPELYLSPLRVVALLPVYIVWALPTVGWLLLVSSWARTKPFLWAVGVPVIALLIVKWISYVMENLAGASLNILPYAQDAVARLLTGIVPGIWFSYHGGIPAGMRPTENGVDLNSLMSHSYMTLAGADAWLGALVGGAMLFAAMRLRRWRDEG